MKTPAQLREIAEKHNSELLKKWMKQKELERKKNKEEKERYRQEKYSEFTQHAEHEYKKIEESAMKGKFHRQVVKKVDLDEKKKEPTDCQILEDWVKHQNSTNHFGIPLKYQEEMTGEFCGECESREGVYWSYSLRDERPDNLPDDGCNYGYARNWNRTGIECSASFSWYEV